MRILAFIAPGLFRLEARNHDGKAVKPAEKQKEAIKGVSPFSRIPVLPSKSAPARGRGQIIDPAADPG